MKVLKNNYSTHFWLVLTFAIGIGLALRFFIFETVNLFLLIMLNWLLKLFAIRDIFGW